MRVSRPYDPFDHLDLLSFERPDPAGSGLFFSGQSPALPRGARQPPNVRGRCTWDTNCARIQPRLTEPKPPARNLILYIGCAAIPRMAIGWFMRDSHAAPLAGPRWFSAIPGNCLGLAACLAKSAADPRWGGAAAFPDGSSLAFAALVFLASVSSPLLDRSLAAYPWQPLHADSILFILPTPG